MLYHLRLRSAPKRAILHVCDCFMGCLETDDSSLEVREIIARDCEVLDVNWPSIDSGKEESVECGNRRLARDRC